MVRCREAYEVDTDGRDVGLGICVVGESQEQARLSNTGVTDEEKLEEVVVSVSESIWAGSALSSNSGRRRRRLGLTLGGGLLAKARMAAGGGSGGGWNSLLGIHGGRF